MFNNRIARHLAAWLVTTICLVFRYLQGETAGRHRNLDQFCVPSDGLCEARGTKLLIHQSWIAGVLGLRQWQPVRVPRTNRSDGLTTGKDR